MELEKKGGLKGLTDGDGSEVRRVGAQLERENEGVKQRKERYKGDWKRGRKEENMAQGGRGCRRCSRESKQHPIAAVRARGAWYRGVHPHPPPHPPSPSQRGQLSYVGLTASVCRALAVCLDSSALLSQQLNNSWLKKASIQSGPDLKITPRKVHKLQTKHTDSSWAHTCK